MKKAEKQEKTLLNEMRRENSTEFSIQDQNDILTQLRIESQDECQKYKDEHKITSDLFEANKKKNFSIIYFKR